MTACQGETAAEDGTGRTAHEVWGGPGFSAGRRRWHPRRSSFHGMETAVVWMSLPRPGSWARRRARTLGQSDPTASWAGFLRAESSPSGCQADLLPYLARAAPGRPGTAPRQRIVSTRVTAGEPTDRRRPWCEPKAEQPGLRDWNRAARNGLSTESTVRSPVSRPRIGSSADGQRSVGHRAPRIALDLHGLHVTCPVCVALNDRFDGHPPRMCASR